MRAEVVATTDDGRTPTHGEDGWVVSRFGPMALAARLVYDLGPGDGA